MAITWETQISSEHVASKRANVSFIRTDSDDPDHSFRVSYNQVIIETTDQRLALLNQAWGDWQEESERRATIAAFITNLEQLANANLMAREV